MVVIQQEYSRYARQQEFSRKIINIEIVLSIDTIVLFVFKF